jgi:hypothetical protein
MVDLATLQNMLTGPAAGNTAVDRMNLDHSFTAALSDSLNNTNNASLPQPTSIPSAEKADTDTKIDLPASRQVTEVPQQQQNDLDLIQNNKFNDRTTNFQVEQLYGSLLEKAQALQNTNPTANNLQQPSPSSIVDNQDQSQPIPTVQNADLQKHVDLQKITGSTSRTDIEPELQALPPTSQAEQADQIDRITQDDPFQSAYIDLVQKAENIAEKKENVARIENEILTADGKTIAAPYLIADSGVFRSSA